MEERAHHSITSLLLWLLMWNVESGEGQRTFVLGGLFPVHQKGNGATPCGAIMKEKGIQRMEAMLYAIKSINKDSEFRDLFTLEAKILDTCSSDSHALNESLKFLNVQCGTATEKKVTGVIGAANSPVSESVGTIFRLFHVPQISYASTSTELDDTHKYPYFFRVVPSDKFQVMAIVDLLHKLHWTYLSTVTSTGDYGEKALQVFENHVRQYDICFSARVTIERDADDNTYKEAIKKLKKGKYAKAVLVFLNEGKLKKFFTAAKEMNVKNGTFMWLGSDSWGSKYQVVHGFENVVEGAITILPMQSRVPTDFDEYFKSLKPESHNENEWFPEFWKSQFGCDPMAGGTFCSGKDLSETNYTQEGLVPMVIDAVYVMAHALKAMCTAESHLCGNSNLPPPGERLIEYIKDVSIASSRGGNMIVSFDVNRSVPVNYTIFQFRKNSSGDYSYIPIGYWNKGGLNLKEFPTGIADSTCGKPCKPGWQREYTDAKKKCCWKCSPCPDNQYVVSPTGSCTPCREGLVLKEDATGCVLVEPQYFGMDLGSPWVVIPFVFAVFGVVCSTIMYITFWVYHRTPIIMASGRELCHLIFLGIFLCYCFTFLMVNQPSPYGCGLVRAGLGLGLAICYSAIFTKTNRLSRIFNRRVRSAKRPRYVTPKSQLIICLCLLLIEITLSTIWLLLDPPKVIREQPNRAKPPIDACEMHDATVCLALAFNVTLIIMCTIYAYKTRKIPENFNEAKYISFVMYSTCIIWMAFVPTYFGVSSDYKVRSTLLCMSVSMSGTVALGCIFVPKLYIVIFQPQKNVRYPTTTNSLTAAYTAPIRYVKTAVNPSTLTRETEVSEELERSADENAAVQTRTMNSYEESKTLNERKISKV